MAKKKKAPEQCIPGFFEIEEDWEALWEGMPEYVSDDMSSYDSIIVHFRNEHDRRDFYELIDQPCKSIAGRKARRSIWFPEDEPKIVNRQRKPCPEKVPENKYPIYVISKGRWKSRKTVKALDRLGIDHMVVVEPQEYDNYASVMDPDRILVLPFSNLGRGSIPARNWVWEHSLANGDERHWILDDNIREFYRLNHNDKLKIIDENPFLHVENFADRFENVAIAGMHYYMFAPRKEKKPPFYLNTRVYSNLLIRNDIPFRWRGKYNEDTDLCLRVLKAGWCTALINAYLVEKTVTMTMKGGNMDELYVEDGRRKMAESLQKQHPDIVEVTYKWGRWQHHVDYRPFRRNQLIPRNHHEEE